MDHIQFSTAPPNAWLRSQDLKASISNTVAFQEIAETNADFIQQTVSGATNAELQQAVNQTGLLVQPLITSLLLEGNQEMKPPCYDNPPSPQCWTGCPWTEQYSQNIMSGFNLKEAKTTLVDVDGFHPVYQTNPVHLPKVLNKCTDPEGCVST